MSQRKMLYAEAEGSYTDILYMHILNEKVFPENDGAVKEVRIGGKKSFVRVDLVSRYGQPERYFGIEVKYWPGAFEQGFKQADRIKGGVHAAFLGIPAEDVPVAQEVRGRRFRDIGVLPISRIFPTKVAAVKASLNANPDQNAINQLSKHFDDLLYGKEYSETYYSKIWDVVKSRLTKRRKFAFLILFLSQT